MSLTNRKSRSSKVNNNYNSNNNRRRAYETVSNSNWQLANSTAIQTFWSSSILIVLCAIFICTPLALVAGPLILSAAGVAGRVVELVEAQLSLLWIYPLFFALYITQALGLCVVGGTKAKSNLLVIASLPVIFVSIPVISWWLSGFPPKQEQQQNNNNNNNKKNDQTSSLLLQQRLEYFSMLASGWNLSMFLELALMTFLCSSICFNLFPRFKQFVSSAATTRKPKVRNARFFNWLRITFYSDQTLQIFLKFLLPSVAVFVASHTCVELSFLISSSASSSSSSSACGASASVVSHQVRFASTLIPHGIVQAFNTLFAREIGAQKYSNAALVLLASLLAVVAVCSLEGFAIFALREEIPSFFHLSRERSKDDACVFDQFSDLALPMGLALVFEYCVHILVATLRLLQWRQASFGLCFAAYWLLFLPLTSFFAYQQRRGAASTFYAFFYSMILAFAAAIWIVNRAWYHETRRFFFSSSSSSSSPHQHHIPSSSSQSQHHQRHVTV